jgi:SAD/SRA domain
VRHPLARKRPKKEQKVKTSVDKIHIKKPLPDDDDPIFGENGPMAGTMIKSNTVDPKNVVKSLILNPQYNQRNAKVFGHNGLPIGVFFLRQLSALSDGAHGSSQGGIAGSPEEGVYSIIVTGHYKDLEKDALDRFEYCATGSMDNTFSDSLIESQGLKALRKSHMTKKPIRVLRGQNKKFAHAPKFGLRYDGLYTVVGEMRRTNPKGGLYAVFLLERVEGQEEVDLSRPNEEDRGHFVQLRKMLE